MAYTQRYRTPSSLFPTPSPTSLERLVDSWEALRKLDLEGYRTSYARPMSTWLVDIQWADGRSVRSPGLGTTCSPFVTQAVAMAYSAPGAQPLRPLLSTGEPLSFLFSRAANGTLRSAHQRLMDRYGMTLADNEWPRPVIFFNMGFAVEPTQMRRGDAVHIDWMSGGGHAVFCWDVHLNEQGEVDAFQYVSANGRLRVHGTSEGAGLGVSVGGTPSGDGGLIRQVSSDPIRYEVSRSPLFVDDERYVAEGAWITWNPHLKLSDLVGCRVRPRGRLAYARVVKAARFHGVVAPAPFAMGDWTHSAAMQSAGAQDEFARNKRADLCLVQKQLKLLHATGWIASDPGESDGLLGKHTKAAIRTFQADFQLQPDGILGPKTRDKLQEVYQAACLSPAGKEYLATGTVSSAKSSDAGVSFAAESAPARILDLYFRHGTAFAGAEVEVIVEAEGLDEKPLSLYLRDAASTTPSGVCASFSCMDGRASVSVRIPNEREFGSARQVVAGVSPFGYETAVPLAIICR